MLKECPGGSTGDSFCFMDNSIQKYHPRVVIIVISQEDRPVITECLNALLLLDYPAYEILIVDYHTVSPDWAGRSVLYPPVLIVQTPQRLGIASARNFGMTQIKAIEVDYIFHLDNDLLLPMDFLKEMVSTAKKYPDVALLTPKIYQNNGLLLSRGGRYFGCIAQPILTGLGQKDSLPTEGEIKFIDFATGAIGLIKSAAAVEVGLFDTQFDPYGFEDIDWCLRIRKAGFKIAINEKVAITHFSDYSFHLENPARLYETTWKRVLLARKHLSLSSYYLAFLPYFFLRRCLLVILKLVLQRRWELIPLVMRVGREAIFKDN